MVLLLHVWECCWAFTRFDKWPHFLYDLGLFVHGPEKLLNVFCVRFVCIWIVMKLRAVYCMLRCSQSADCLVCIQIVYSPLWKIDNCKCYFCVIYVPVSKYGCPDMQCVQYRDPIIIISGASNTAVLSRLLVTLRYAESCLWCSCLRAPFFALLDVHVKRKLGSSPMGELCFQLLFTFAFAHSLSRLWGLVRHEEHSVSFVLPKNDFTNIFRVKYEVK